MRERATCDEALNARDAYGDGDQSFLDDEPGSGVGGESKAQPLREMWSTGGDSYDMITSGRVSEFFLACFSGDVRTVKDLIARARRGGAVTSTGTSSRLEEETERDSDGQLKKLLERRETSMRFSPIFAAITGARTAASSTSGGARELSHLEVVRALVEAGANVHARDIAGYSPLAHCVGGFGDMAATLDIAIKVLGPAGANPNAVNRFGEPPLESAIMTGRTDTLVALLELGADPNKEHVMPGHSAYSMAHELMAPPEARDLFAAAAERVAACGYSSLAGREVTIQNLSSRADLNGRAGVVNSLVAAKGRYLSLIHI